MTASIELLEEAATRFVRANELAPDQDLDRWLNAAPAHRLAYAQVCAAWYAVEPVADADRVQPKKATSRWVAALGALMLIALAGLWLRPLPSAPTVEFAGLDTRATPNAVLHIDADNRKMQLDQGRLWIDVADGNGVEVALDGWRVVDVGTRFLVDADRGRVVVFAGAVEVYRVATSKRSRPWPLPQEAPLPRDLKPVRLEAGDGFDLRQATRTSPDSFELGLDRNQWLFLDVRLGAALDELERESGRPVWLLGSDGQEPLPRMILPHRDAGLALQRICSEMRLSCTDLGGAGFVIMR